MRIRETRSDPFRFFVVLRAGLIYFALVFAAGFILGAIRVSLLVPYFGTRLAELAEMPVMLVVITLAARYVSHAFTSRIAGGVWLAVGSLALALLIVAELLLAVLLQDGDLGEYIASRDPVSGSVYLAMLLVFTVMPWLQQRSSRRP